MEEKKDIWEDFIVTMAKKWIVDHAEDFPMNGMAKQFIVIKPKYQLDYCINFLVKTDYGNIKSITCDYLIAHNGFNGHNGVINTACYQDENGEQYTNIVYQGTLKADSIYVIPRALTIDFVPGSVAILHELDINDGFIDEIASKFNMQWKFLPYINGTNVVSYYNGNEYVAVPDYTVTTTITLPNYYNRNWASSAEPTIQYVDSSSINKLYDLTRDRYYYASSYTQY